ncbi:MAG: hypothetical protein ACJASV_002841 [Pseudorhodobacter sp.]|jgi:hypothetical protein
MNVFKNVTAVVCVTLATAGASWANDPASEMQGVYFEGLKTKLVQAGYHSVRVVNTETRVLVAIDKDGSEVVLVAHPFDDKIVGSTYVHQFDN